MTNNHMSKSLGIVLVIISSFCYSLQVPFRYLAAEEAISSLQLAFLATLVASLIMIPCLPWCLKHRPPWTGILMLAFARTMVVSGYFQALQILPPSMAVMFLFSGPLLTLLQTALLRLEKPTMIQIFGFFFGIAGLALSLDLELDLDLTGVLWALLGGVGLSWEYLAARIWIPANTSFSSAVLSIIASNLFIIPIVWYFGDAAFPAGVLAWYPVSLMAIMALILPTVLLLKGIAHAGANTASLLALTEPLFTITIAIAFGWDDPGIRTWLGMMILMTALGMVVLQSSKAK